MHTIKSINEILKSPILIPVIVLVLSILLFHVFYLDGKIIGDQLGLWSYISTDDHRHTFSLWNERASAGAPQGLNPEYAFLDVSYFLTLLIGNIVLRSSIINTVHLAILAAGAFFLTKHLTKDNESSLVAASICIFSSGAVIRSIGNNPYFFAMTYLPFLFLFLIKLLQNPKYSNAYFTALFGALIILSGGISTMVWLSFFMLFFFIAYFLLFFDKKIFKKQILLLVIAFILLASFSAFKIWGGFDYLKDTNTRPGQQPYELFVQGTGHPEGLLRTIVSVVFPEKEYDHIGLWLGPIGIILVALSIYSFRKKSYWLIAIPVLISVLLVSDTIVTHLAHQIPYINRTKDLVKTLFIFGIFTGVMAGFGFENIKKFVKIKYLASVIIALVFFQFLFFFIIFPKMQYLSSPSNVKDIVERDYIFNDLDNSQPSRLSYKDFSGGIVQIRLSEKNIDIADWIHGNGFSQPFIIFKQVALSKKTDEFLGLLNVKYIYDTAPLKRASLIEIKNNGKEFLYENSAFLPRYRSVYHSVLVFEDISNPASTYAMLTEDNFNITATAIITSESLEDLRNFDIVIIGKNPTNEEIATLRSYSQSGGIIFPNVFNMQNISLRDELRKLNKKYEPLDGNYGRDKLSLEISKTGWVVLSETYSIYSGWEAKLNGKKVPIYRANGINTAVYAGEAGKLELTYRPKAFYQGGIISALAFIFATALVIFLARRR